MVNFIQQYGVAVLHPIVLICWFLVYKKTPGDSQLTKYSIKIFVIFLLIFIFWDLFAIIFEDNKILARFIYLFFWVIITIYEFFIIGKALFISLNLGKNQNKILIIILLILSVPVILAAVLSHTKKTYNPINTTDFYNMILLLFGTVLILKKILSNETFVENIESFFIYTGFALYFGLHILASNTVSINFQHYWFFAQHATLISLIYWTGSVLFIWKIKSNSLF
jgi:hypothetical protein